VQSREPLPGLAGRGRRFRRLRLSAADKIRKGNRKSGARDIPPLNGDTVIVESAKAPSSCDGIARPSPLAIDSYRESFVNAKRLARRWTTLIGSIRVAPPQGATVGFYVD